MLRTYSHALAVAFVTCSQLHAGPSQFANVSSGRHTVYGNRAAAIAFDG